MEEKEYKVYYHKNKINNKLYIGITKDPLNKRWRSNGEGYARQPKFYNAIKKYGWDNFDHILLIDKISVEEAKIIERELIKIYNTKENGYNNTEGGEGLVGYHHSEETKKKMSESAMGKPATNNRPVRCIELKKVFNSARQAALYYNVAPPTITRVCQGIKPTAAGFHWCYEDQYNIEMEKDIQIPTRSKPVYCITAQKEFKNASEACKWCNLKRAEHIHNVCKGEREHAGRHPITNEPLSWRYLE